MSATRFLSALVAISTVLPSNCLFAAAPQTTGPLRIHPDNPRYFADSAGRTVWLTGSHTWANFQERGVEGQTPDFGRVARPESSMGVVFTGQIAYHALPKASGRGTRPAVVG
jgi:hypothetical protein